MNEVRREELSEIELKDCMRIISDPTQRFTHDQKGIAWDQIIASRRALAARVQAVERERDEWEIKCRDKWDANTLLRRELAKLQGRFNSEVEASIRLEQRLAEAQGRVAEVGELNIKLRDAERQVEQLREACEPLVAIYAEESTATDSPYFDGPILTKAQVRAIQHALREPEGGPKYAKEMDHE